jgi:RNA polymerase sigma-70 factor (ECF subfamily)
MRLLRVVSSEPSSPDDAELLARARRRDGAAFRALFLRHGPAVRRLLGALFRDAHAADEATQETFVRAHSALGSVREGSRLRGWLLGIARIVWLDEAERLRRETRVPAALMVRPAGEEPMSPSAESSYLDAEADQALAAALARLAPQRRTALLLRLDQGLAYDEIAQVLRWPLHKVKNEIHRARLAIRDELLAYLQGASE